MLLRSDAPNKTVQRWRMFFGMIDCEHYPKYRCVDKISVRVQK